MHQRGQLLTEERPNQPRQPCRSRGEQRLSLDLAAQFNGWMVVDSISVAGMLLAGWFALFC